jgi:hypothetical protein
MELFETNLRAKSTLASTLASGGTSFVVVVVAGSNPIFPTANFAVMIDDEKIDISSRTGDTFTIETRGYEDTSVVSHDAGAVVSLYSYLPPNHVDTEEKVQRAAIYT